MENGPEAESSPQGTRVPHDWRWALGVVGKIFITLGLLILAFVAYQLWGTGIEFRANQRDLAKEFRESVAEVTDPATATEPTVTSTTVGTVPAGGSQDTTTTAAATTTTIDPLERLKAGDVLAALKMPAISDTTYYVVAGVRFGDLKRGIGHYPGTALPGQFGNAALAGHRTTYGAPFENLDQLQAGDLIIVDTVNGGHYEYAVERQEIIEPDRVEVLAPPENPDDVLLTLTTCHPKRSVSKRLVIHARLLPETSSGVAKASAKYSKTRPTPPAVVATTTTTIAAAVTTTDIARTTAAVPDTTAAAVVATTDAAPPTTDVTSDTAADTTAGVLAGDDTVGGSADDNADNLAAGWFKDSAAWPQIILWGLLLAAIALGIHFGGRRAGRRWLAILIGAAPFVVVLYFFFQNVNRLLPPGL